MSQDARPISKLKRLTDYLAHDPSNTALLSDTIFAAFDEGELDLCAALIARYIAAEALPPALLNLKGLVALKRQEFAEAEAIFGDLRKRGNDDPILRFNIAWTKAMMGAYREALDLLDNDAVAASPRAPSLKIQMMHHLGLFEAGLTVGQALVEAYPANPALMGALATLAMDAGKPDLALHYARNAGDDEEGRVALGLLTLDASASGDSLALFERATDRQPQNPRAWIGKGLALLATGNKAAGAQAIDRGAELFHRHIGSWVAAGWAHFINHDYVKARVAFQHALAIDSNFAESHGGIAVLDIAEGKLDAAHKNTEIALRLDKNCFGGALAKILLLEKSGQAQLAQRVRAIAMSTPVGPSGRTLAQALTGFSNGIRR